MSIGVKNGAILNREKTIPRQEDYKRYMEKIVRNISGQDGTDKEDAFEGWIESSIRFNPKK